MKTSGPVHGNARLSECGKYLTVTTMAKKGKKFVENVVTYLVEDVRPDPRVADPAYSLTKGVLEGDTFTPSGEVWHVSVREYGPECDCPHRTFNPNSPDCKHVKAAKAVGLFKEKL